MAPMSAPMSLRQGDGVGKAAASANGPSAGPRTAHPPKVRARENSRSLAPPPREVNGDIERAVREKQAIRARMGVLHSRVLAVARDLQITGRLEGEGLLEHAERACDQAAEELVSLGELYEKNRALLEMAGRPPLNGHHPGESAPQIGSQVAATSQEFPSLLVALSDLYAELRSRREGASSSEDTSAGASDEGRELSAVWAPPDVFERTTTKYWVRPRDSLRLKAAIIKHLPLLLFGESPEERLQALACHPRELVPPHDAAQSVQSVYLDNARRDVYQRRLMRHDGASLVRVRWYARPSGGNGGAGGGSPAASPPEAVFIERKVHREAWTGEKSSKERARMSTELLPEYLRGPAPSANTGKDGSPHRSLANGSSSSIGSSASGASGGATPPSTSGRLREALGEGNAQPERAALLLREVWEGHVGGECAAPVLRTSYDRTAFQEGTTNRVRISLDSSVVMAREVPGGGVLQGASSAYGEEASFPCEILEVKLQDETPPWLQGLLAAGLVVKVPKFSKFLHGMALLHVGAGAVGRGEAPLPLPYWFVPADSGDALPVAQPEGPGADGSAAGRPGVTMAPATFEAMAASELREDTGPAPAPLGSPMSAAAPLAGSMVAVDIPELPKGARGPSRGLRAPGRCWPGWKGGGHKVARPLVRTRVEPKTFFANERTFLAWLSIAVLIMFTALSLLNGGTVGGGPTAPGHPSTNGGFTAAKVCGVIVAPVSLLFMGYSLHMYHKRTRQIMARETVRFDDEKGPVVLVVVLGLVTTASYVISVTAVA